MQEKSVPGETEFSRQVGEQAARKLKAERHTIRTIWFGLGMMGMVGWSVVVPTLLGTAFGIWLDSHYPGSHSWTLTMLAVGLALGCVNGWYWVAKEDREIHKYDDE